MSQMVTRKGPVGEEKEKRQTDSPVKDMKKKIAANAEKDKQTSDKNSNDKQAEKTEKTPDKAVDKKEKNEKADEKKDKSVEKSPDKNKPVENKEKPGSKQANSVKPPENNVDKKTDKKEKAGEKSPDKKDKKEIGPEKEDSSKDKSNKVEATEEKKKPEDKVKQNGARVHNGATNGDTVKATRTPETPRPASEKQTDKDHTTDDSKEKVLKLKEDPITDRKLRSADSPKPQEKKVEKKESPKKPEESSKGEKGQEDKGKEAAEKTVDIEVIVEVEAEEEARKVDTNYSKSRVKVSPYRRSLRHDNTDTSLIANYTGNNTTMEMDITESSVSEECASPYLSGLRAIRGRRSYKPLKEMALRNLSANRTTRSTATLNMSDHPIRPTGTVVGRKRKPESEEAIGGEVEEGQGQSEGEVGGKRARLLQRLARPFRSLAPHHPPQIVGINTDLPLTAPVVSGEQFDPEAIKPDSPLTTTTAVPAAVPLADRDNKRCAIV